MNDGVVTPPFDGTIAKIILDNILLIAQAFHARQLLQKANCSVVIHLR